MRAVYSSSARNVWVDKERLIVLIVGCMADMIAVRGDLKIFGSREGGGAVGNNVVSLPTTSANPGGLCLPRP
jgi:hypothetical protein